MLLIIGIASESPVKLLTTACENMQVPYILFNQRMQQNWSVDIDYVSFEDSTISDTGNTFRIGDFTGIYLRTMDHTQIPGYGACENKKEIDEMYTRLFMLIDNLQGPRIANCPTPMMSNNSKPYQSMVITKFGLSVPDTCITNNKKEALAFISKYKQVIYKSVSGTRSIVKQVDENSLKNLDKILYCPVQFQECVTGDNARVHVIGYAAIATRIKTNAVDYRYAHTENKFTNLDPMELDALTADKCVRLSQALQLPFSGIDLMFTEDGRTICFEVNPSPGYSYYENNTGQLISHALATYLAKL